MDASLNKRIFSLLQYNCPLISSFFP